MLLQYQNRNASYTSEAKGAIGTTPGYCMLGVLTSQLQIVVLVATTAFSSPSVMPFILLASTQHVGKKTTLLHITPIDRAPPHKISPLHTKSKRFETATMNAFSCSSSSSPCSSSVLPSSCPAMSGVMELNNRSVALLMEGKCQESIQVLQLALTAFGRALDEKVESQPHEDDDESDDDMSDSTEDSHCTIPQTKRVALPAFGGSSTSDTTSTNNGTNGGAFEVFNRAFIFTSNDCVEDVDEFTLPAILLYNIGICYHHLAFQRASHSQDLKLADSMYGRSLQLLEVYQPNLSCDDCDSDCVHMVLVAALANNMAHIASSFFDVPRTQVYQQLLTNVMDQNDMDDKDTELFFAVNLFYAYASHWNAYAPSA